MARKSKNTSAAPEYVEEALTKNVEVLEEPEIVVESTTVKDEPVSVIPEVAHNFPPVGAAVYCLKSTPSYSPRTPFRTIQAKERLKVVSLPKPSDKGMYVDGLSSDGYTVHIYADTYGLTL